MQDYRLIKIIVQFEIIKKAGFIACFFYVLSEFAEILYKTDSFYNKKSEITLRWDDPVLDIDWPLGSSTPILSDR